MLNVAFWEFVPDLLIQSEDWSSTSQSDRGKNEGREVIMQKILLTATMEAITLTLPQSPLHNKGRKTWLQGQS